MRSENYLVEGISDMYESKIIIKLHLPYLITGYVWYVTIVELLFLFLNSNGHALMGNAIFKH